MAEVLDSHPTAKNIGWHPILSMPDDRKDGRQMLLWCPLGNDAAVATADSVSGLFFSCDSASPLEPTYWADINAPARAHD